MLGPGDRFPRPFGDHLLLRLLAQGGMAQVFEAEQAGPGGFEKRVALKRLLPEHRASTDFVRALIREARLGALFRHPNLCAVHQLGVVEGDWYFTLELVDGLDLHRLSARFRRHQIRFPVELALYVVAGVCAGLHHAHEATDRRGRALHVVHRDVSPQNVVVSPAGGVKIVDFGIARSRLRRRKTAPGIVKGKWAYMSPEQARGHRLDRRADVYSVGMLLLELVTGVPPRGSPRPIPRASQRRRWPPSPRLPTRGPRDLAAILERSLASAPEDRYPTALALGDAVSECLHRRFPRFTAGRAQVLLEGVAPQRDPTPADLVSGGAPVPTPLGGQVNDVPTTHAPAAGGRRALGRSQLTPTESVTPRPIAVPDDPTLVVDTGVLEALRLDP